MMGICYPRPGAAPAPQGRGNCIWDDGHPPLEGEGRTAEGSPGWGDGGAADDGDAVYEEALSPPPGPLTQADLPPPGGGE